MVILKVSHLSNTTVREGTTVYIIIIIAKWKTSTVKLRKPQKAEIFPKCEFLEHNNCKLNKNYNAINYFLPLSQPRVQGTFHNSEPYPYPQSLEMFGKNSLICFLISTQNMLWFHKAKTVISKNWLEMWLYTCHLSS